MADYIVHKAIELDALSAKAKAPLLQEQEWIISPKYDGCHVVFLFKDGAPVMIRSRTGEVVASMDHVAVDLQRAYPDLLAKGQVAITGEAWMVGEDFNVISGTFRRQYPQPQLCFVPFDIVAWEYNDETTTGPCLWLGSEAPYAARIGALSSRKMGLGSVLAVNYRTVYGTLPAIMPEAEAQARFYKASTIAAYDGVIAARAEGRYIQGAGKGGEFIKVKPLISFTVTVHGAALDCGEKTGKHTAALRFMLDEIEQKVSTGLTQAQVEAITSEFQQPDYSPKFWRGARIEVEAMGKTVNGFLREPRFKGIRIDA